jgi:DNA-binding IclR family transcriptional regulator
MDLDGRPTGAPAGRDDAPAGRDDAPRPSAMRKAFDVLGAFSPTRPALTLSEIARLTGLPKSTVHRLLGALIELAAVERHDGSYRIGPLMMTFGASSPAGVLRDLALPHLETLHRFVGYGLHLAILDGSDVVYLEKLRARSPSPAVAASRLPALYTAVGKVMLAFAGPHEVTVALTGRPPAMTAWSAGSPQQIRSGLERARLTGVAVSRQEAVEGLSCMAAPVILGHRAVAAVSVALPTSVEIGWELANPLRQTARAIARSLSEHPRHDLFAVPGGRTGNS